MKFKSIQFSVAALAGAIVLSVVAAWCFTHCFPAPGRKTWSRNGPRRNSSKSSNNA